jgi:hypothetical protein
MLRDAGWQLNDKRVERLSRHEGLKFLMKQSKRSRLWLDDGSCIRLRPQHVDHVGHTTSSTTGQKMSGRIGRSTSSMSSAGSVWSSE